MTDTAKESALNDAAALLTHYSFDLGGYTVERLIDAWLREYPAHWLRSALIEALYQGRYKAISVRQILMIWGRRGQPRLHFNHDFERMICSKLPKNLNAPPDPIFEVAEAPELEESRPPVPHPLSSLQQDQDDYGEEPSPIPDHHFVRASLPSAEPQSLGPADSPHELGTGQNNPASVSPEPTLPDDLNPEPVPGDWTEPLPVDSTLPESPIQTFKPISFDLRTSGLLPHPKERNSPEPIHQFIPAGEGSQFYSKLKAVAYNEGDIEG